MTKILKTKYLFVLFILFIACKSDELPGDIQKPPKYLTVATFNVEWLGDMVNDRIDRVPEDYKLIAEIIKKSNADLIALQEIENDKALKLLTKYLDGFKYYVGKRGGQQNLGLLYKKNIKVKFVEEYSPLIVEEGRTRPGLIFECKAGNFDFVMMVVHYKSTSRFEDTKEKIQKSKELRAKQIEKSHYWADSILRNTKEQDIIILGDFNDTPVRKKDNLFTVFLQDTNFVFLTQNLKSCKYPTAYSIDHILVSRSINNRYLKNSLQSLDFRSILTDQETKKISDHCPVSVKFDVSLPDND
ncbi:MAG: endonuclease/exonuclease/phosphatase family protein [Candidatus Kapabacteria bacterium]|nr:endonuclease/exonuclease/phosphatase family protein [Candidatus Kapabacteria bacterium]